MTQNIRNFAGHLFVAPQRLPIGLRVGQAPPPFEIWHGMFLCADLLLTHSDWRQLSS